ncbi:hypothetical protein JW710_04530 [Candidatus Dojkabacteria bacterium]|nr:hypothetical protein [Candidatus Dojkabacteria bacterium]
MKFLIVDKRKRVGNLSTPHYAVQRLQEALDKKKIEHDFCHFDELSPSTNNGNFNILAKEKPITEYTHIIFRGHRSHYEYQLKYYTVLFAEKHDIRVQNSEFIKMMPHYNKIHQMVTLGIKKIPYVDSYYCVDGRYHEKKEALERIGFPLIYKHTEGAYRTEMIDGEEKLKKNVYLINNIDELKDEIERRDKPEKKFLGKDSMYFIQKYVDIGEDYRAIMLGGKFLSGWKRIAQKGFLTVSHGEYSLYEKPEKDFLELSEKVASLIKADYCAIDIIYVNGKPYVLEINMEPGFKSFETKIEGAEVDVAESIIDNMLEK